MSDENPEPKDERVRDRSGNIWYKWIKGILVAMGLIAVAAIMIVGLVLGACFFSSR